MRPVIFILHFLFIINTCLGQTRKNILFDQDILIKEFHTLSELEKFEKRELIRLYTTRVKELFTVVPYIALTTKGNTSLQEVGIEENSSHLKTIDKQHQAASNAFEKTKEMINELIPLIDNKNIIWSILYFEEMIKNIRMASN